MFIVLQNLRVSVSFQSLFMHHLVIAHVCNTKKLRKHLKQMSKTLSIVAIRACLHEGGGPQVGEVKYGGSPHLSCKRDQIKMRDYMDRRVTPPKQVTWGSPPP